MTYFGGSDIRHAVVACQYAPRGELPTRAAEIERQLAAGARWPFARVRRFNVGNPLGVGNEAVLSLRAALAHRLAAGVAGLAGYSDSQGLLEARQSVAAFIERRDGLACPVHAKSPPPPPPAGPPLGPSLSGVTVSTVSGDFSRSASNVSPPPPPFRTAPADEAASTLASPEAAICSCVDPSNVFLGDGATAVIRLVMEVLAEPGARVLVPQPEYPLYSALLTLRGASAVPYALGGAGWRLERGALERAAGAGPVRAVVAINPGNPCGFLDRADMEEMLAFCARRGAWLLADEVYQENLYGPDWVSFRRVLRETRSDVPLVSFHSASKGLWGECGLRGGYAALDNVDARTKQMFVKLASLGLCPNLTGQLAVQYVCERSRRTGCVCGEQASDGQPCTCRRERAILTNIHAEYKRKAQLVETLNEWPGVEVAPVRAGLYAFPRIHLPPRYLDHCAALPKHPGTRYCLDLLENTGLCMVPGAGFGEPADTYHLRMTILPPDLEQALQEWKTWHATFMQTWA